jgi:alpha-ribazole phosphatase/probable phosphoglycerate mutase
MIVYLLRHGTPVGGRMYRGNLFDDPLTEEGWDQMKSSVTNLSFDTIATSPMKRCSEFADYISKKSKIPYSIIEDFKEIGFGDWQGKTSHQIGEEVVERFKNDPINNPVNNAENLYDFQKRVIKNYLEILDNLNPQNKLLIIAHAGVIRVIKSYILKLPIEKMFTMNIKSGSCEPFEI